MTWGVRQDGWGRAVQIELMSGAQELEARFGGRKVARATQCAPRLSAGGQRMTNLGIAEKLRITVTGRPGGRGLPQASGRPAREPRPGARARSATEDRRRVTTTLETMPVAATHWSTRSMAKASGLSSRRCRIWRRSRYSRIAARLSNCRPIPCSWRRCAISSACIHPPDRALVLCVDENHRSRRLTEPNRSCQCAGQAERRTQ